MCSLAVTPSFFIVLLGSRHAWDDVGDTRQNFISNLVIMCKFSVLLVQKECKRCSAEEVPFYSPHPFISIAGFSAAAGSMKSKVEEALRSPTLEANRDKARSFSLSTSCYSLAHAVAGLVH